MTTRKVPVVFSFVVLLSGINVYLVTHWTIPNAGLNPQQHYNFSAVSPLQNSAKATSFNLVRVFPNKSEEFLQQICETPSKYSKNFFHNRDYLFFQGKAGKLRNHNRLFFNKEQKQIGFQGLLYIKLEKSASSTLAGINYRIAAEAFEGASICQSRGLSHLWNTRLLCHKNGGGRGCNSFSYEKNCDYFSCVKKEEAFLWTLLRAPETRSFSEFFYFSGQVVWNDTQATTQNFIDYHLNRDESYFYQYRMITSNPTRKQNMTEAMLSKLLQRLDFIGLVERMDDSLCVLGLLLNLDPSLLVHVSDSKVQGSYVPVQELKNESSRICKKERKPFKTREMNKFYQSSIWEEKSRYSRMLYDAVNQSLDATIDHTIGRDRFDTYKLEYLSLLHLASKTCQNETVLCRGEDRTNVANEFSCYHEDSGCGYHCLNKLFSDRPRRYES